VPTAPVVPLDEVPGSLPKPVMLTVQTEPAHCA
jgi:hypothetical protein